MAPEKISFVVEQKMPLSLTGELGLLTPVNQFNKVGMFRRLTSTNRRGWKEKENE